MKRRIKATILPDSRNPLRQFPVCVLLALLTAAVFFIQLVEQGEENFTPSLLALALSVAFIASAAAYFLVRPLNPEARYHDLMCHGTSLGMAVLFFALSWLVVPPNLYLFVIGGFALTLIALAPIFYQSLPDEVWLHVVWTVLAAFLSLVVFIFWMSAFYTIQWMVNTLFPAGQNLKVIREIIIGLGILVSLLFFLVCLPPTSKSQSSKETHTPLDEAAFISIKPVFDFLLVPIIFIMALVLHIYAAAITLRQAFPDGQIGKMVTLYVCFVLSIRFVIHPFLSQARLTTRLFAHLWAFLLLVPLAILLVAVTLRTGYYGMTINRYYLYLGALATIAIILAQLFPRWRHDIRVIALIPGFCLIISVFGPWSVQNWVGYSQAQYLIRHYVTQGRLNFSHQQTHPESRDDLLHHVVLLDETRQLSRLLPYVERDNHLAVDFIAFHDTARERRRRQERPALESFMQVLGLPQPIQEQRDTPVDANEVALTGGMVLNRAAIVETSDYDLVVPYFVISPERMATDLGSEFINARIDGEQITLRFRNHVDSISLPELLAKIPQAGANRSINLETAAARAIRLIPLTITRDEEGQTQKLIITLMLRQQEWGE